MEHQHSEENYEGTHSKYDEAISKYNTTLSDEEIAKTVKKLIEEKVEQNNTLEVKKLLFNCIDLTSLKCTDNEDSVLKFTEKVNDFEDKYPDLKNVASICVYPCFAQIVSQSLEVEEVGITCVSAGFLFTNISRNKSCRNCNGSSRRSDRN